MMVESTFRSDLRGFQVYSITKNWKPSIHQHVEFMREHRNPHDKFAVAGRVLILGTRNPLSVGHIPHKFPGIYGMLGIMVPK